MTILKLGEIAKNFVAQINGNFAEIAGKLTHSPVSYKVLYSGVTDVPSRSSGTYNTIALNDNITAYDGVIIQREGAGCWERLEAVSVSDVLKVVNSEADFDMLEGLNIFLCNVKVQSVTTLRVSDGVYSGVKTSGAARYNTSFDLRPITKVIGVKLN